MKSWERELLPLDFIIFHGEVHEVRYDPYHDKVYLLKL